MALPAITRVSVVIPVKDGERFLEELLTAVGAQAAARPEIDVAVLVVDSGSTDASVRIARASGAEVLEIPPAEFGHGRTRNLAAEATDGEVIAFLTQDATPLPGWLDALLEGFSLSEGVGVVYGPHRARADTSPMIARELDAFFAGHREAGGPTVQRTGGLAWLSNVNAAYRRDCWAQLRFAELAYSEDQAFGEAMLRAGWVKVFHPGAAVAHAHDYPPGQFARRYFDEYRGLKQTVGHVEPLNPVRAAGDVRGLVAADRSWMRGQGFDDAALRRWTGRSVLHHSSRKAFGALGSRAASLPAAAQRRLSLEGTVVHGGEAPVAGVVHGELRTPQLPRPMWNSVLEHAKRGTAPLLPPSDDGILGRPWHIAAVIPPFQRGSGGHMSLFQILLRLERMGHDVSIWIDDELGHMRDSRAARIRRQIREWFVPLQAPVYKGFDEWFGADIGLATGWQTAHSVAMLGGCRARAYLVQDHEPEFYPTSAEATWAAQTYTLGLHHLCGSPYLEQMVQRYGGTSSRFSFGIDLDVYKPSQTIIREPDTVVMYGRDVTPRRAVPLAIMALSELLERRPQTKILSFGSKDPIETPFPYEHLGILNAEQLAATFARATVGLVLSMTNYSVIPQEMLACGLPVVELAGVSGEGVFGENAGVVFAEFNPVAIATTLEAVLGAPGKLSALSASGIAWAAERTWEKSANDVAAGMRLAILEGVSGAPKCSSVELRP